MIIEYTNLFIRGIAVTFAMWFCAGTISLFIGLVAGITSSNQLTTPQLKTAIVLFVFIARGVPAYVQILIAYFILPSLLGIDIPPFVAACGALSFCSSGYMTEIIRSGINSVPKNQWQACKALGYSLSATLTRIILPQALRTSTPALCGEGEQLLKSTSLLATIGITEITRTGMNIISRELNPIPVYLTIACLYLVLSFLLNRLASLLEKRLSYG